MTKISDKLIILSHNICSSWGGGNKKHVGPNGGVWLARIGGLSPVKQRNNTKAPDKHGYWAFIWPYIEPYLIGSTNDRGIVDRDKNQKSRAELWDEGKIKLRKFCYVGELWTYWPSARKYALETKGEWYLVDSRIFCALVAKEIHHIRKLTQVDLHAPKYHPDAKERIRLLKGPLPYSKDWMEVFIPARKGSPTGKPDTGDLNFNEEY